MVLKAADNPPVRRPECESVKVPVQAWWVAHTKARFEKAFAWDLLDAGIDYFLPMIERTAVSGGRKRKVLAPLFPSYVFFNGDAAARQRALATNRLCQVIPVVGRSQFLAEVAALETVLESKVGLDPYPQLAVGRRCRIVRGPLLGLEGTLVEKENITRIVLHVSMLGQGAAVEIAAEYLETID